MSGIIVHYIDRKLISVTDFFDIEMKLSKKQSEIFIETLFLMFGPKYPTKVINDPNTEHKEYYRQFYSEIEWRHIKERLKFYERRKKNHK